MNIKKIRNDLNMTQTEFARALGLGRHARKTVSNWEKRKVNPSQITKLAIKQLISEKKNDLETK